MSDDFIPPSEGWVCDPEAVAACVAEMARSQDSPLLFAQTEAGRDPAGADTSVLLWLAEAKVRGSLRPSWDQGQVGTCVSFGYARGCTDLIMGMAARGEIDAPAADVATEPVYAGSRVEVGGGRISGDGSVGAWAADWLKRWGVVLRGVYGPHDLTSYSESRSRSWGRTGCPDDLEPVAKMRPVRSVALVQTAAACWDAIGSGYPVPVCSGQGFTSALVEGFCRPSGSWAHCMLIRGRVVAKRGGGAVKAFAIQNSWGGYLSGERAFTDAGTGGRVELPEGCFLADWDTVNRMLSGGDSFALSDLAGFPRREALSWLI